MRRGIEENGVARLRDTREDGYICIEAGVEEEGGRCAEKGSKASLERGVRGGGNEQAGAAGAEDSVGGGKAKKKGSAEGGRGGEGEVVVGGEVNGRDGGRRESTSDVAGFAGGKRGAEMVGEGAVLRHVVYVIRKFSARLSCDCDGDGRRRAGGAVREGGTMIAKIDLFCCGSLNNCTTESSVAG